MYLFFISMSLLYINLDSNSLLRNNEKVFFSHSLNGYFSNKLYYIPHNIMNFLFLSAPAFVISIGIMYVEMDIIERFLIFIFISLFYFYFFISSYKKNIESLDNNNLSIN